jgi:gliding motility-associated-like protein
MKNKLLLFLLFFSFLGINAVAQSPIKIKSNSSLNLDEPNTLKTAKVKALIPPPLATAGSSCKEVSAANTTVVMAASGGSGDIIEWFSDQTSSTILHSGPIYGPSISKTTTYYVWSHSGADYSIRVPVVASVFVAPPTVTLTVSPSDNPICEGTSVTFTANGGADLFEFSVNGIVTQAMSLTRTYTTSMLKKGQTVSVRTRYGVTLDGVITETAWGKGLAEDNFQSASLSTGAVDGYINGIKISPTEKELIFGLPGKLQNNGSILLFLDTKPGGFNLSNFGDVASSSPTVRSFNFFNNNPSTFDSYFEADYCLVIAKDNVGTSYLADVIELKTGNSIIGSPNPILSVNEGNSGINDYDNGFEVSVLKSLIGYKQGDIKFFAFTMQNDIVTNSFLSPELSSSVDYGNGSIDYNFRNPNPVVVSADALNPCYKEASLAINLVEPPTTATVGADQFNCTLTSGSLGGNTPTVGSGGWSLKSGPGVVSFSNATSGSSTAAVDMEGSYIFTWTISNSGCPSSFADIKVEFLNPLIAPAVTSVTQPTCAVPSGSISVTTQPGVSYSLDGNTYQSSNIFAGLAPGSYTLYVRKVVNNTCILNSSSATVIDAVLLPPTVPTASSVTQPTCAVPSGSITIDAQPGVEYSLNGSTYQSSNTFAGLAPDNYILYIRKLADNTCVANSGSGTTINAIPLPPAVPISSSVTQPTCAVPTGSIIITAQSGVEYSLDGAVYQTSNTFAGLAPNNYTLFVRKTVDNTCVANSSSATIINAVPLPPAIPTASSVTQPTCAVSTGSITIATQSGVEYSLNGTTYQSSSIFSSLTSGNYTLYVRKLADNTCSTSSSSTTTINAVPLPPAVPISSSVTQPTCAVPTGSIIIAAQSGVEYSLDGTIYQTSNTFTGLAPNNYTLYVRKTADNTCVANSSTATTINAVPLPPVVPTASSVAQPTCAVPTGSIIIVTQSGIEYSVNGTTYQASNSFTGLAPGTYTLYVRKLADNTCVTSSSSVTTINTATAPAVPTTSSVAQPTCAVSTGSISITAQTGVEYSLNGTTYQLSNIFSGLLPGSYSLYVRKIADATCFTSSPSATSINIVPLPPAVPAALSVTQPTCAVPTGSITIATQSGIEYSLDGITYQTSNIFTGLAPKNYTLYVRKAVDNTCVTQSVSTTTINARPNLPIVPTTSKIVQPTCSQSTGEISIVIQSGVEYSVGSGFQASNVFQNLMPGNYTLSVRFVTSPACISTGSVVTINPIPPQIQFEIVGDCTNKEYVAIASPLANSYNPNNVDYQWKDSSGSPIGTNSNILNVSDLIESTSAKEVFPLNYTLTVVSTATGCETTKTITVETIYCNIQKGISPDGNGSNDYFDLRLMDVKKLEIFNRYGIKVYEQSNYTDQWKGQSDKGDNLPSATYYYVIELNKGVTKTGWIYLIREK